MAKGRRYEELTLSETEPWQVQSGSALALDDARTAPFQVSHSARHALTVAVDHMHCLRTSLFSEGSEGVSARVHTHAQYSLLRGVIENAARAVWLLAPDFRQLRIERRLALQAKEVKSSTRMHERLGVTPARSEVERLDELKGLLIASGTPTTAIKQALSAPTYTDIVKCAGEHTPLGETLAETVWSACSSLAHGDITGTLGVLPREIVAMEQSVSVVRITGGVETMHYMAFVAVAILDHGFMLYRRRSLP
ncbi:hypothetical protein [Streptomyces sp. NPDC047928]|uniref:hypothetical protein n=1 Tax=unclassified Streptomyces TaxID=2593676 RepID=UPI003715FB7A